MSLAVELASFRPIVGIDLGTTNSALAYIHNGVPEIIPLSDGQVLLPSVVLIDPQGKARVGRDARDGLLAMPDRAIAAVKRQMGETNPITLGDQHLLPEEVSALILKELRQRLTPIYGEQEIEAVITVPAYFSDIQRRATKRAGELAGFVVERIINEPTAAALAYGLGTKDQHKRVMVYDLGGGTFDVSVLTLEQGVLEVHASNGNRRLGGEDFDWVLVDWMAQHLLKAHGIDPRSDLKARAQLKDLAEQVKWTLSEKTEALIESPILMVHEGQAVRLSEKISRRQFITLIRPFLDETIRLVSDVLDQAKLKAEDMDEVLLVGGSTRIPEVHAMLTDYFGRPMRNDIDPDLTVALGAAVQAGLKSGALLDDGLVATDVAPFSMGIASARPSWTGLTPGYFAPIIPRNTTVPCTRTEVFTTSYDGQSVINVEVYQGEDERVSNNLRLGSFALSEIPPAPAGMEKIEVSFRYNLNGILEVTARIVSTTKSHRMVIQDGLDRQSEESLKESRARLAALSDAKSPDLSGDLDWEGDLAAEDQADMVILPPPSVAEDPLVPPLESDAQESIAMLIADLNAALVKVGNAPLAGKVQAVIEALQSLRVSSDVDVLERMVDQATDLLMELDLNF